MMMMMKGGGQSHVCYGVADLVYVWIWMCCSDLNNQNQFIVALSLMAVGNVASVRIWR